MRVKQYSKEEHSANQQEDIYWIIGARWGSVIDARMGHFDLKRHKNRWIIEASDIPKEWLKKNNHIYEVKMWRDGTALFEFHGTSLGMFYISEFNLSLIVF